MGYLRKEPDGSLLYNVVNQLDPDAEGLLSLCNLLNIFYNPVFMQHLPLHFYDISEKEANCSSFFAEEETHKVDLSSLSNKLLPGLTTLGFKDDRRHKGMS